MGGREGPGVSSVEHMISEHFFLHRLLNVMYEFPIHLWVKDGENYQYLVGVQCGLHIIFSVIV